MGLKTVEINKAAFSILEIETRLKEFLTIKLEVQSTKYKRRIFYIELELW